VLVKPGPAVTAATPILPDNLATASAAKTALTYNLRMKKSNPNEEIKL
jgi:hypothetical protein